MQHLLQFLYEHALDRQLYCVIPSEAGELHLTWRAESPQVWEVRAGDEAFQQPRAGLLDALRARGADLPCFERELESLVAAHVVVADQLLAAAQRMLGGDHVRAMLRGQEDFVSELRQALTSVLPPRLRLVR